MITDYDIKWHERKLNLDIQEYENEVFDCYFEIDNYSDLVFLNSMLNYVFNVNKVVPDIMRNVRLVHFGYSLVNPGKVIHELFPKIAKYLKMWNENKISIVDVINNNYD